MEHLLIFPQTGLVSFSIEGQHIHYLPLWKLYRASQTLFLSDLIDVQNCKDPGYGKIHIGLYMSILHDVIERTTQQCSQEEEQNRFHSKKRRQSPTSTGTPAERPNTRAHVAKVRKDEIDRRKTYHVRSI